MATLAADDGRCGVTTHNGDGSCRRPEIEVAVPATSAYLSVVRTAAAALAARLDFTLDDIEDLRMAVDEACSILLTQVVEGSQLKCSFYIDGATMTVSARAHAPTPRPPSRDGFAWMVLTALTSSVDVEVVSGDGDTDHELVISLTHSGARVDSP